MNGNPAEDMDRAWREYLMRREENRMKVFGWNPRELFEAGYKKGKENNGEVDEA